MAEHLDRTCRASGIVRSDWFASFLTTMKIERHEIEKNSIEDFADQHNLVMEVHERRYPVGDPARYYAHFKSAEAREGMCALIGLFGNGATPEEAIAAYAEEISLRTLIIDAMRTSRREIRVPRLHANDGGQT